jgi:hypothetical protein
MSNMTPLFSLFLVFCGYLFAFDAKDEITQINRSCDAANNSADVAAMTPLLTDDFQFVMRQGSLLDKKAYLTTLKAGKMLPDVHHETTSVRVYDNAAVVVLKSSSATAKDQWYTTRTFVKQGGAWKMAMQQATVIAPRR